MYIDGRYGSSGEDVINAIMFTLLNCTGSQFSLEDCSIIDNCTTTCSTPVAIKCYGMTECTFLHVLQFHGENCGLFEMRNFIIMYTQTQL